MPRIVPKIRTGAVTGVSNSGTATTVTVPAETQIGDLHVLTLAGDGGIIDNIVATGWTEVAGARVNDSATTAQLHAKTFYRIATAAGATAYSFPNNGTNVDRGGVIATYQAGTFDATNPIDALATPFVNNTTTASATTTTVTSPTITTVTENAAVLFTALIKGGTVTTSSDFAWPFAEIADFASRGYLAISVEAVSASNAGVVTQGSVNATYTRAPAGTMSRAMSAVAIRGYDAPVAALVESIKDDFSAANLSTTTWTTQNAVGIAEGNLYANATLNNYSAARTDAKYKLSGSSLTFQITRLPQAVGDDAYAQMWVREINSSTGAMIGRLGFEYRAKENRLDLIGQTDTYASIGTTVSIAGFNPAVTPWLRLSFDGTSVYWYTSPDAKTWTLQRTLNTPPAWVSNSDLQLSFEAYRTTGVNDTFRIDNLNMPENATATVKAGTGNGTTDAYSDGTGTVTGAHVTSGSVDTSSDGSVTSTTSRAVAGHGSVSVSDGSGDNTGTRTGVGSVESVSDVYGSGIQSFGGDVDSSSETRDGTSTAGHSGTGSGESIGTGSNASSGAHTATGHSYTASSIGDGLYAGAHRGAGQRLDSWSSLEGDGYAKQLGSAGIAQPIVGLQLRLVDQYGLPGDFLPDWTEIAFTQQYNETGTIAISYAKEGIRSDRLLQRAEGALFDGTFEVSGSRFVVTQSTTDGVKEDESGHTLVLNCPQYVPTRLGEATIYPPVGDQVPVDTLKIAAQELLGRVNAGLVYYEDFSFPGMSAVYQSRYKDLAGIYHARYPDAKWPENNDNIPGFLKEMVDAKDDNASKTLFSKATPGNIIGTFVQRARNRGALNDVSLTFSSSVDSLGHAWNQVVTMTVDPGGSVWSVLETLTEMGVCDWWVDGRNLYLANPDSANTDRTTGSYPIVLSAGRDILDAPEKRDGQRIINAVLVMGKDGIHETVEDATAIARDGRVEGFVSTSNVSDRGTLRTIGRATIKKNQLPLEELTHGLALFANDGPQPWTDYFVGDWVYRDARPGKVPERYRVVQLTCTYAKDGAVTGAITLGTKFKTTAQKLAAQIEALTGGSDSSTSAPASTPADDLVPPRPPVGLILNTYAYDAADGGTLSAIDAAWSPVQYSEDGTPVTDLDHYEVRWKRADSNRYDPSVGAGLPDVVYQDSITPDLFNKLLEAGWVVKPLNNTRVITRPYGDVLGWSDGGRTSDNSLTFSGVDPGMVVYVQVRAVDRSNNASGWSTTAKVLTQTDDIAPPKPTAPVVTAYLGTLRIAWDGQGV